VHTLAFFNGVDSNRFNPAFRSSEIRRELADGAGTVALYAGLFGIAQGLDQLLAAAERLKGEDMQLVLIGDGPEKAALLETAKARSLDNVKFLPPRARTEMPALVASADIAIVPLRRQIPGAVPSKLYEAMASGLPVVLVAAGEPAEIVRSTGSGIVVAPGDVDGLANTLRRLARAPDERAQLGDSGRAAAVANFDRKQLCDDFIRELEK